MHNTAFSDASALYYNRINFGMLALVKEGPNIIMDLGCASGRLGERLREAGKAEKIYGVEIFAAAAAEAQKTHTAVHVGDIEDLELNYDNYFDYVLCGDILEHLRDPYKAVDRIYGWLKPGGSILACVPNVRSYRVWKKLLLNGEWEYVSAGIMDKTHLRFFTRRSCRRMLEAAGFEVYHEKLFVYGSKKNLLSFLTFGLLKEFLAEQLLCCGLKPIHGKNQSAAAPVSASAP
jgi:2-polyprenyl-3-methyl-5-hydroxy-6-metoxy-1,4-benzoquinol methylase